MRDAIIKARVERQLKADATAVLGRMGLTLSDAVRMMLVRTVEEGDLPFRPRPNAETVAALEEARAGAGRRFATPEEIFADLGRAYYRPGWITFTGADDRTDPAQMEALARDYPVEFGILFSRSREGDARYPSRGWIEGIRGRGLHLAAHICGAWSRDIVERGACDLDGRLGGFARAQINTAATVDPGHVRDWAIRAGAMSGHPIMAILQCRDAFPDDPRVAWLFDPSGGGGTRPDAWPEPPGGGAPVGYAGGLGPGNIAEILEELPASYGGWLDMESGVRGADGDFDLGMCRRVCEEVFGHAR